MMELTVIDNQSVVEVSDKAFDRPYSEGLIHQAVVAYMAGGRAGTKATKSRSDVRGGGRKPWKQKGTGNARAGTIRSPIWRSGGHTFALRPRDFSQKLNRKMYRGALASIVSELVRQDRLKVVSEFKVDSPKTKLLAEKLADYSGRVLIVCNELEENLYLAARNLPNVGVIDASALDPMSLVSAEYIIVEVDAVKKIEEALG